MDQQTTETGLSGQGVEKSVSGSTEIFPAFAELKRGVYAALEYYSGVNRGNGHTAKISAHFLEQAKNIVLAYLSLKKGRYIVIFCSPRRAEILKTIIAKEQYKIVSSRDIGLPLGLRAIVVKRNALTGKDPFHTGGGTAGLVSADTVIWADAPEKYEPGTPALINIITFTKALKIIQKYGPDIFNSGKAEPSSAKEILYSDNTGNLAGKELSDTLRKETIGRGLLVPTVYGYQHFINLDNASTTPAFVPVWESASKTWDQPLEVKQDIIKEVKSVCAEFLDAPSSSYEVIFTSNTTEAINLVAEEFSGRKDKDIKPVILNTILEHSSNELPWRMLRDYELRRIRVNKEGFINLNELNTILCAYNQDRLYEEKRITLVAVSGASNVLGVFNDLEGISRIVHHYGARLLVDAAQLAAHRRIRVKHCGIDYLVFSAHKIYAPFGTGVLVAGKGMINFSSRDHDLIRSSGEENVSGIAALGKALLLLQRVGFDLILKEECKMTGKTLTGLSQIPGIRIFGIKNPESPSFAHKGGIVVFDLKNINSGILTRELAERGGIGVRCGYHNAHILIRRIRGISPLFERIQNLVMKVFPRINLPGLVRVSIALTNTDEDIDTFLYMLGKIARQRRYQKGRQVRQKIKYFITAAAKNVYS